MLRSKLIKNTIGSFLIGAVFSYFSFNSKSDQENMNYLLPTKKGTEFVFTKHLTLNKDETKKLVTITSEEKAIEDMRYLSENSAYEESWVQIPLKNREGESLFLELSNKSEILFRDGFLYSRNTNDVVLLRAFTANCDSFVFHHFHPDYDLFYREFLSLNNDAKGILSNGKNKIYTRNTANHINTYFFLKNFFNKYAIGSPSYFDLKSAAYLFFIHINHNSEIRTNNKITSSIGISEYTLTEEGKTKIVNGELSDYIGKNFDTISSPDGRYFNGSYFKIEFNKHERTRDQSDDLLRDFLFKYYSKAKQSAH